MAIEATSGRTMTVGGVLSRAFAALGAAPAALFGTSFVLAGLPPALIALAVGTTTTPLVGADRLARLWPALIGGGLAWLLFYVAAQAIMLRATVSELDHRDERFGDLATAAMRSVLPLIGLTILFWIAVGIGWVLLFVPGVILAVMWSVAAPALVEEGQGMFAAFGRSRQLTSGARWRIFGLFLIVVLVYFAGLVVIGLGSVAALGLRGAATAGASFFAIAFQVLLRTVFAAIWTAIQAALYVALRDWKDGPAGDRLADIFA